MSKKSKNTILEKTGFKSWSQGIREISGWTQKEFETQKRVMRMRVANLNKLTGANLSAIEELFYKVKYEDRAKYYASKNKTVLPQNPIQKALSEMTTTKNAKGLALEKQEEIARNFVLDKFEGLAKVYKGADNIRNDLILDTITPKEANERLTAYAEQLKVLKRESPASWLALQDEEIGSL